MSSSWVNKSDIQNQNGGAFISNDFESSGFSNPALFEPSFESSQFQNQQLQRMQNGSMRNGSPTSFNNPQYQTNSLIPSKRPREESMRASPQQTSSILPLSRSQTPQQNPHSSYQQSTQSNQHSSQQISYPHLQEGSGNATPSPVMTNQLRPNVIPQRVSTASPHPFSPAAQQFPQLSPSLSDQGGSRSNVSQQSNPYTQTSGFSQGFGLTFSPSPGRSLAIPQTSKTTSLMQQSLNQQPKQSQIYQQRQQQSLADQQRIMYQMQLQHQYQQRNMLSRSNIQSSTSPILTQQISASNGQFPGSRLPLGFSPNRATSNTESFMKSLVSFMQGKKLPLEMNPVIGNRPISLPSLYLTVAKFGGYKRVMAVNGWDSIAAALQFHPLEYQTAPQNLRAIYERNLVLYEEALAINQRQRAQLMQQNSNILGPHMSPTKQTAHSNVSLPQQIANYMPQQQQRIGQHLQNTIPAAFTPTKQAQSLSHQRLPSANGFSPTESSQAQLSSMNTQALSLENNTGSNDTTPPQSNIFPLSSPASTTRQRGLSLKSPHIDTNVTRSPQSHKVTLPNVFDPKILIMENHGGADIQSLMRLGGDLSRLKPDIPAVGDLGVIDVHALTMSLQSGIHAEVRLALDTLVNLSMEPRLQLDLRACEDLVESLIDCADAQVELLAENSTEVSDVMLISSYEDVLRGCRYEQVFLQEIPVFGSWEYELDRAVDRLICITTIMRNLSFYEANHPQLADELVVKFMCVVIRHLGTRNMLLRTHSNTLDFMKDVIIFFSNLAQQIELPGREQALCLLQFLLAFAPCPTPKSTNSETITFSPYNPNVHRYLPPAVDCLAKILARDEPNRSFYKTIFVSDVGSTPQFDLLTKAFALAISAIPAIPEDRQDFNKAYLSPVIEARKPFLMQGILAAGILSNLAPGYETGVAKSWLTSEDGFSQNLCQLIISLCLEANSSILHQRQPVMHPSADNDNLLHIISGGITVLRRLVEKSRDPQNPNSLIVFPGTPVKGSLLAAINIVQPRLQGVLKQLYAYAGLGT